MVTLDFGLRVHDQAAENAVHLELPSELLPPQRAVPCMPALRHVEVQFNDNATLSFGSCPALPALRTVWCSFMRLQPAARQDARSFECVSEVEALEFAM